MRHQMICFSLLALLGCSSSSPTTDASVSQDVVVVTDRIAPTDAPTTTTDAPTTTTDVGGDGGNPCDGLGSLCHEVDPGSGPIHDCHEGAHDGNAMWCATNGARCRALCIAAADAGVPRDSGAPSDRGAVTDDGHTAGDGGHHH